MWECYFTFDTILLCTCISNYQVKSSDTRRFVVTAENEKIGELNYDNWYSFKSELLPTTGEAF